MSEETDMAYVAVEPGMPGCVAAIVINPESGNAKSAKKWASHVGTEVARWIRDGYTVERWPCARVRDGFRAYTGAGGAT